MFRIAKITNTVKYLTPRQWKYRLYYSARNKIKKRIPIATKEHIDTLRVKTCYSINVDNREAQIVADGICENIIPTVSGNNVLFENDWDLKNEEYRLVSFKLNSFQWLLYLSDAFKNTGDAKYIDKGFDMIDNWYQSCTDQINGDKWNAYVIAERITNWIGFVSEYSTDTLEKYASMIFPQAQELKESIEFQLGANHLLSEAKALVVAGTFLNDEKLYEFGKKVLIEEATEQFLPDGGHYERSVSYHIESLQQYFESFAILKQRNDKDITLFIDIMRDPFRFLNGMIGVNGRIPLFNDSAHDYPFYNAADLLNVASYLYKYPPPFYSRGDYSDRWKWLGTGKADIDWDSSTLYPETGFIHYRFSVGKNDYSFFMDCGDNGPDYNLGHAHADALSVLLYSNNHEILVDTGVFTYKPGQERNKCRSTNAHNTVEIDDVNSAEVWAAFRVAKRGHSHITKFSECGNLEIKSVHDGYEKCLKKPATHCRCVRINDGIIEINDELISKEDHKAISRFHLSPRCNVYQTSPYTCNIDNIIVESSEEISIVDCKIASSFGVAQASKCIEIDFNGKSQLTTKFTII